MSRPTFPHLHLETARVTLRPFEERDAVDVLEACRDEQSQRWLPLPNPYTPGDAMAWCTGGAEEIRTMGDGVMAAAVRRSNDRLVGSFGLRRTDWRDGATEIGFWVAPWARGEGLAVEITLAIARWVFDRQGFHRLVLRAATGNRASQRVAEKAGFTREGIARSAGITSSGRVDLVVYSLLADEPGAAEP